MEIQMNDTLHGKKLIKLWIIRGINRTNLFKSRLSQTMSDNPLKLTTTWHHNIIDQ